jgi:starch synthase (maltosyl-transferring)
MGYTLIAEGAASTMRRSGRQTPFASKEKSDQSTGELLERSSRPWRTTATSAIRAEHASLGPRIYNLFPRLVGPVDQWRAHLPRIAAMGFDWLYVNAFFPTGGSGSLYAVADPLRLAPEFLGSNGNEENVLHGLTAEARDHGLRVMIDLSLAHIARDSALVAANPGWFRRRPGGELLAVGMSDPGDLERPQIWQDLIAFDYGNPAAREGLIAFWRQAIGHFRNLGVAGFVAKATHRVPADVWKAVLQHRNGALVVADTLGARPAELIGLDGVGFDYVLNSLRWWDRRAEWLFEEQERLRPIAPSISFPEIHDTERLAAQAATTDRSAIERYMRGQLALAAFFSAGWMMPIGVEYGFTRRLDPVTTRPDAWETPQFDLSSYIATLNALRAEYPAFSSPVLARRLTAPDCPVIGLVRYDRGHPVAAENGIVLLLNRDAERTHVFDLALAQRESGGRFNRFADLAPASSPEKVPWHLALRPQDAHILLAAREHKAARRTSRSASEERIRILAGSRVVIENVQPQIDGGRYPVKRVLGDSLTVTADIFLDGHEKLAACVKHRQEGDADWQELAMEPLGNDRWAAVIPLRTNAFHYYTVEAWHDRFGSWRAEYLAKRKAGQATGLDLAEGIEMVRAVVERAAGADRQLLDSVIGPRSAESQEREEIVLSEPMQRIMRRYTERGEVSRFPHELSVIVDRLAAQYSAWYELFPRSQTDDPRRHGTFDDVIARLPYVRDLGFDVLYFPPIHPIGTTNRKGRNNSLTAVPGDPGSPYAIGAKEGGHAAVHPELGTIDDFRRLVVAAHDHGLEIALDFAVQCSLDHPWIKEHPEWFSWRTDGTIKYAENPPKKYEDIVNVDFQAGLPDLWFALRDVVLFWIDQGVKIFRVDNPHTKPFAFWEWMIGEVRQQYPDVIFLAEAFTRPKVMKKLAKLGFNQSYTYFTWRNTKRELIEYLTELTREDRREYYRPNFFVNTPDINPIPLQTGGRPLFQTRLVLAATLSSIYGIYSGYELCEAAPLPGREEYLNSEKYEIRVRDYHQPGNIVDFIATINRIRRANPALHDFRNLLFCNASNDNILVYAKMTPARDNVILIAVNLDPRNVQSADFEVPLWELDLPDHAGIGVDDLLTGRRFVWQGKIQRVHLDPSTNPVALWRLEAPTLRAPGLLG